MGAENTEKNAFSPENIGVCPCTEGIAWCYNKTIMVNFYHIIVFYSFAR